MTDRIMMNDTNERLMKFLQATREQQDVIDRVLSGETVRETAAPSGPLLLGMGVAARVLGVSRATLWRMIQANRVEKVELLPGSFRVRRADIEAVAAGKGARK